MTTIIIIIIIIIIVRGKKYMLTLVPIRITIHTIKTNENNTKIRIDENNRNKKI